MTFQQLSIPTIMGILNVTPDSFYDGGRYTHFDQAINQAKQMVREGADIIDVGGESTRPGAIPISNAEECDRIIPIIKQLKQELTVPISVDTRHAEVMTAALAAGADIINDINALQNPGAIEVAAARGVPVCLMHMQGTPQNMQNSPTYRNILQEIYQFFVHRIEVCEKAGILRENIWVDPGFGFGKDLAHNLTLLANLSFFKTLGVPLLVGLSRKSMFGKILNLPLEQRLNGSLAGAMLAAMQGASIIRTHDVAATKEVIAVLKAVQPYSHST